MAIVASGSIPNRQVFRAQEVCEIADVQPYVLRSWEAEFPDLGVAKSPSSARVYRRADVERVLRLKHLLFVDGLTLAGARKQLIQEGAAAAESAADADDDVAMLVDRQTREQLRDIRGGLQWILGVLGDGARHAAEPFALEPPQPMGVTAAKTGAAPAARVAVAAKPAVAKKPAAKRAKR